MAEGNKEKFNIRLHVYDEDVHVSINRDDEEYYRRAAKLVSDGDAEAGKAFAEKNTALAAAKRGYVDEIIEPQETRQRIAASLQMLGWKSVYRPDKKNGTV